VGVRQEDPGDVLGGPAEPLEGRQHPRGCALEPGVDERERAVGVGEQV